jgi:hypothetical protein
MNLFLSVSPRKRKLLNGLHIQNAAQLVAGMFVVALLSFVR